MNTPWYALYVTKGLKARDELREAKVEVFLPTYRKLRQVGRLTRMDTVPLLEGYLFVRIQRIDLRRALDCESVVRALGVGDPRVIPEPQMQRLREEAYSGKWDDEEPGPKLASKPPAKKKKSRQRGIRRRGLDSIRLCLAEAEAQDIAEAA